MEEDYELAFKLQLAEALAASTQDRTPGDAAPLADDRTPPLEGHHASRPADHRAAIIKLQQAELDHCTAEREARIESRRLRQLDHDRWLAHVLSRLNVYAAPLPDKFDEVDDRYFRYYMQGSGNSNYSSQAATEPPLDPAESSAEASAEAAQVQHEAKVKLKGKARTET